MVALSGDDAMSELDGLAVLSTALSAINNLCSRAGGSNFTLVRQNFELL